MIIVTGLPGAGKSTVLNGASSGWKMLNYGDLMFEIAQKEKLVSDRDEMRKLAVDKQKKIQAAVAKSLSKETGKIILDTHAAIKTKRGYLPGLPFSLLKDLKVEGLVFIQAPVEQILRRRSADKSRVRELESREEIEEHLSICKAYIAAYSAFCGVPAVIISNEDNGLEKAVQKLRDFLAGA
ncbi:Adenylate kinase [Candidatus Gugararchaeum adminiculabundum]|nr:Adenylate kinase [Candidatus Gugararchaeum adminiculabundum]